MTKTTTIEQVETLTKIALYKHGEQKPLPTKTTQKILTQPLYKTQKLTNQIIQENINTLDWLTTPLRDNAALRAQLTIPNEFADYTVGADRYTRNALAIAMNLMKGHYRRSGLYVLFQTHGKELTIKEARKLLKWRKLPREFYNNVSRMRVPPQIPYVKNPKISGGTLSTNVIKKTTYYKNCVVYEGVAIGQEKYDLVAELAGDFWDRYPKRDQAWCAHF